MSKIKKKASAFMHIKNNFGFTLISMLTALTIILISLPLFFQLIKMMSYSTAYDALSVQQFTVFLRDELFIAVDYKVEKNKIILTLSNGDQAHFLQSGNNIARKVSGGHEIYLRGIEQVRFEKVPHGVHTLIITEQGELYEKTIGFYK